MSFTKTVNLKGIELFVIYDYTPAEVRNTGHPDFRLPDVEEEYDIISATPVLNKEQEETIISQLKKELDYG